MKRRLFTLLSALSLLLCVGTCVMCIRSYYQTDEIYFFGRYSLSQYRGHIGATRWHTRQNPLPEDSAHTTFNYETETVGEDWFHYLTEGTGRHFLGFTSLRDSSLVALYVSVPHGMLAILLAVAPIWRGYKAVSMRRLSRLVRSGRCPACGYDLRATPDRCPECGTVPPIGKVEA